MVKEGKGRLQDCLGKDRDMSWGRKGDQRRRSVVRVLCRWRGHKVLSEGRKHRGGGCKVYYLIFSEGREKKKVEGKPWARIRRRDRGKKGGLGQGSNLLNEEDPGKMKIYFGWEKPEGIKKMSACLLAGRCL